MTERRPYYFRHLRQTRMILVEKKPSRMVRRARERAKAAKHRREAK
jgi:hypothetical protein